LLLRRRHIIQRKSKEIIQRKSKENPKEIAFVCDAGAGATS